MTARGWIKTGGVALVMAAAAVMSAGPASAADWTVNPGEGYVNVDLDHVETSVLANTAIPDWIDRTTTPEHQFVDPAWYSTSVPYQGPDGRWYSGSTFAQLWREAAAQPAGAVSLWLTDPAQYSGIIVQLRQY
ncbi:hypothetical protein JK358_38520 [Nocardia sp. 2]|uniref:Uncharacterized protein n=1 Tax=Nocardia acididurans TaxID=2802282 RepID=A0ABS1MI27_9NOCA|nr:hypothetical protein [Nocardia acididurans]MBL1080307.1 hypothetical protein [Nocardia acididurans]